MSLSMAGRGGIWAESSEIQLSTWCSNAQQRNWPYDKLECDILITMDNAPHVRLILYNDTIKFFQFFYVRPRQSQDFDGSEWKVVETVLSTVQSSNISNESFDSDLFYDEKLSLIDDSLPKTIKISVVLARNSSFYNNLLLTPLIGMIKF